MKSIFLIFGLLCYTFSSCQPLTISGRVINEERDPVPGATIMIKGTNKKAVADQNGNFTIQNTFFSDTLIITAIGYETAEDFNNVRGLITVILKRKITSLNEVIINTGYQEISKERSTGSFEKLDASLFNRKVGSDWLSRLEGVSSVYFDRRVNVNGDFNIRGRSTLFANAVPLIVVDNFPYDGDIDNINPNDIETITILKDAAAASVWGTRAANGVIVITTKKGKYRTTPVFEFKANTMIGNKPDLFYNPEISSSDFIDVETFLFGKGFYNGGISNTTTRPPLSPVVEILAKRRSGLITANDSAAQIDQLKGMDYRNDFLKYFYRNAITQQYAMNYSGGAENISYYLSAGYYKTNTNLVRNDNDRFTFTSRTFYTPLKSLELGMGISYIESSTRSGSPASNITLGAGKSLYPYARLADEQGNPLPVVKDYRLSFIDTVAAGKLIDWKYWPLQELYETDNGIKQSDIRFNLTTSYKYNTRFNMDILYQYEKQASIKKNLYSQNTYFTRNLINRYYNPSATNKYAVPIGSILDNSGSQLISHSARLQANYRQSWSALHEISAIAGAELKQIKSTTELYRIYGFNNEVLTFTNVNLVDNLPIYAGLSTPRPIPNPGNFSEKTLRYVSLYTNAAYIYKKKYTTSFSVRKDASNLFGVSSNQKWVPLWSTGFAWQVNRENFYKSKLLPDLRLRITYGYNGNVDNSLSALSTIRYTTGALFTSLPYATIRNPPNPELRWEKTGVLNFGLDFEFKNNRFSGAIEYYLKQGNDLIGFTPVDPTTGVRDNLLRFSYKGNVARMRGAGVDIILNTKNLVGKFNWSTSLILNYIKTRITDYIQTNLNASAFLDYGNTVNPLIGKPVYSLYSYTWAGLDPATGDPQGYLNGRISKDYSALTGVTVNDLVYHGSAVPEVFGSIRNTFNWKNFSVSANIIFKLAYYFRRTSLNYTSLFNNWQGHADYAQRWQKPGDELVTIVPSMIYPNSNINRDNFFIASEVLVEKGDHIRLQDISFAYDIKAIKKNGLIKNAQIYAFINNIGILWKANNAGLDPDYFSSGFPLSTSYAFGIKTSF